VGLLNLTKNEISLLSGTRCHTYCYRNEIQSQSDTSKIDSLQTVIVKKDSLIQDLESQVDTLLDECQMKEAEISYWGQKYDSLQWK
jgi:hypothetical protein